MRAAAVNCASGLLALTGLLSLCAEAEPKAGAVIPQEAYVWQRSWSPAVREAIAERAGEFSRIVVLNAEVTWSRGRPRVARVPLDYGSLRQATCPVGLALRIGPYAGPFSEEGEPINSLKDLASALVVEAKSHRLAVSELQVDFDSAESKLEGYRTWIETIRRAVSPTPVTITALPSWLRQRACKSLVLAADGWVLQVHSLKRPAGPDALFSLCDPHAARAAVARASDWGVPFRVALPTYGYLVAFDSKGGFVSLSAEGRSQSWPEDTQVREVRADAKAMAQLVQYWATNRPATLQGLLWYRLPTAADTLNWPWPTLAAVMQGRPPREALRIQVTRPEPALVEISLLNEGEADLPLSRDVSVRWAEGRLLASDALQGFELIDDGAKAVRFRPAAAAARRRLGPREERLLGWLRLSKDQAVRAEFPVQEQGY